MMADCRYLLCLESLVRTLLVLKAWNRRQVPDPSMADKTSFTQEPGQKDTLGVFGCNRCISLMKWKK